MKLRTINQIVEMFKKQDADTTVSTYLIRRLAKEKKVKCSKSGTKYIVDYDSVVAYLSGDKEGF